MIRYLIGVLLVICCCGCNSGNDSDFVGTPANLLNEKPKDASNIALEKSISTIGLGTLGPELLATMNPLSIDSGTVFWGGTGARRLYFQVANDKQVWFDLSGPADGNR